MSHVETLPFPLRVVALGGGTGLPAVLRGLKAVLFPAGLADDPERLTAVVTVTDEGGSSGRLRESLRMLPPGDIRNCLVALSHNEPLMARLFQARYRTGQDLEGHPVGNLILAALAQEESGGFLAAVQLASEVLNIQGRVFPSTLEHVRLAATMADGRELLGETALAAAGGSVRRLRLEPAADAAAPGVVEAIERADLVILGPGSLFSSIVPNLLVNRLAAALRADPGAAPAGRQRHDGRGRDGRLLGGGPRPGRARPRGHARRRAARDRRGTGRNPARYRERGRSGSSTTARRSTGCCRSWCGVP